MNSLLPLDLFDIPEIQEGVFHNGGLKLPGLASPVRINHAWYRMASPFLWEPISLEDGDTHQTNTDCLELHAARDFGSEPHRLELCIWIENSAPFRSVLNEKRWQCCR